MGGERSIPREWGAAARSAVETNLRRLSDLLRAVPVVSSVSVVASDGQLPVTLARVQVIRLAKPSAMAATILDPSLEQDGVLVVVTAETAAAHVLSYAVGFNNAGAGADTATWGGARGDTMVLVAVALRWQVVSLRNVTLS